MGKKLFSGELNALPDNLRCRRSDGRQWRCPQPAKSGLSFCEYHYNQVRRTQDSVKKTNVMTEVPGEIKRRSTDDPPLAIKKRRRRQRNRSPSSEPIGLEKMEKEEVKERPDDPKVGMDLTSPDRLRHQHADSREWRFLQPVLPVLSYDRRNLRCKQPNEEDANVIEPKPKRISPPAGNVSSTKKRHRRKEGCGDMEAAEPAVLGDFPIQDSLRCRRSDGRKWRCTRPIMSGFSYCEYHVMRCKQNYNKNGKVKIANPDRESHLASKWCTKRRRWRRMVGEQTVDDLTWTDKNDEALEPAKRATLGSRLLGDDNQSKATVPAEAIESATSDVEVTEPSTPDFTVSDDDLIFRSEDNKFREALAKSKNRLHRTGDPQPSKKVHSVPNHIRCRRSDGRKWRCTQLAMPSVGFCEYHHLQMRQNQGKRKNTKLAPSVKLNQGPGLAGKTSSTKRLQKQRVRGGFPGKETTRTAQKKRGEKSKAADLEVMRELPNGLMAISPNTEKGKANAPPSVDRKLGHDDGYLLGRLFRSKNAERVPLAKIQKLPFFRSMEGPRKRVCHRCRSRENKVAGKILCFSCQEFFCKICIETWHSELSVFEVKKSCPVCRGCCSCINCNSRRTEDECNSSKQVQHD